MQVAGRTRKTVEKEGDKQLMSALSRGIRVLQCFSTVDQELTSKDLTDRTGLARPTIFRITSTLRDLGLLRYSESRMVFAPTPRVLTLGAPVLAHMKVRHLARPMMQQMAEVSSAQILLSAGSGFEVVVVEAVMGSKSEVFRPEIGTRLSLTHTAIGRAYLLSLPPQERMRYIRQVASIDAERSRILEAKLQEDEDHLRQKGFLKARKEARPDVVGTAVAMQAPIDEQMFIFSCSVLPFNANDEQLESMGLRLASLVRNVEASLGNMGDFSPSHREVFATQPMSRRRAVK